MNNSAYSNITSIGSGIKLLISMIFIICFISHLQNVRSKNIQTKNISVVRSNTDISRDLQVDEKQAEVSKAVSTKAIYGKTGEKMFHPLIVRIAKRHSVDPALVMAIVMAESSYNPRAVSKVGARGLMQLMPNTAESLGVKDSFNPEQNIDGGVRYFRKLLDRFNGDVILALAAYNAGSRHVIEYQGIPPFKATRFYIKKVCKYHKYYEKQLAIGIDRV